ncbi:MAG: serine hydrolase domain-containing protein [Solirubrobacterales bacterium]|nr:beta-lactamase family protein [Solirubrobacterales bacterium]
MIFAAAVLAALLVAAPTAGAALTKQERGLQNRLEQLVELDGGPPGASVVLQRGGKEKFLRAGVADVDGGAPFKRRKHMRIASVSKAFSGAVAMSLAAEGRLSLDDTIGEIRPDLPVDWWPVTLRQLLSHTGGVPSFTSDPGFLQYFGDHLHGEISKLGLIDFIADEDLKFPPGSAYEYSNTDNIIIALMAEEVTGRSYGRLLRGLVTRPLGLSRTYLPSDWKLPFPRIDGYDTLPEIDNLTTCCSMSFVNASGGLVSTPSELTTFTRAYVGGELFGGATRRAQFSFRSGYSEPPGPGEMSTGLAMFRYRTRCGAVFGHSGNFPGYTQFTVATRNGRRGLTFTANRQLDPNAPGILAPQAFRVLRKDYGRAVCTLLG